MRNTQPLGGAAAADTAAPSLSPVFACSIPHLPQAVGTVRQRARDVLAAWGVPRAAAEEVVLVVSELGTTAIVHGISLAELRLSLQREGVRTVLRVEAVADAAATPAPSWPGCAPLPDELGCGNAVVKALALRYGTESRAGTTAWWADLPAF